MAHLMLPPSWQGRERDVTDPSVYRQRRAFLRTVGLGTAGLLGAPVLMGCRNSTPTPEAPPPDGPLDTIPANAPRAGYPAPKNTRFTVDRPLTERIPASSYNNFYEFIGDQTNIYKVWPYTGAYEPFPWTLTVDGLVEQPFEIDLEALFREMGLEERIYRHRCVEAWSMTIPWTGFPLRKLIERCKPLSKATHVRFISASRPEQMPGVRNQHWYDWPYYEGLRMDEATNELAFVATGMYGEPLTKQNGSPLRLALPWKYGYKGPKAIQHIVFTDKQPHTFWNDLQPDEYGFLSNVNPNIPHPRWSQASEKLILSNAEPERIPTALFNGYAEWVGALYPDEPREPRGPMAR